MSLWKQINDDFLAELKKPLSSPKVTVRKVVSPIDPQRLEQQYHAVSSRLLELHRSLIEKWSEGLNFDPDAQHSPAYVLAFEAAAQCFWSVEIEDWEGRYLFKPLLTLFQAIAETDPKFLTLPPDGFSTVPVEAHYALFEKLRDLETFLEDGEQIAELCSTHLFQFGVYVLKALPETISQAPLAVNLSLSSPLIENLPEPHMELAVTGRHFFGMDAEPLRENNLLQAFQDKLLQRWLDASGLKLEDLEKKDFDTPLNHLKTPASELVKRFFGSTPFPKFFLIQVPYGF